MRALTVGRPYPASQVSAWHKMFALNTSAVDCTKKIVPQQNMTDVCPGTDIWTGSYDGANATFSPIQLDKVIFPGRFSRLTLLAHVEPLLRDILRG